MTIGERIRVNRKRMGVTQADLGARLGVSGSMIAQYETGKRKPKFETVIKMDHVLGTPWLEFYPEEDRGEVLERYKPILYGYDNRGGFAGFSLGHLRSPEERVAFFLKQLNEEGQEKAVERVEELTEIPRYRKSPETPLETQLKEKGETTPEDK